MFHRADIGAVCPLGPHEEERGLELDSPPSSILMTLS